MFRRDEKTASLKALEEWLDIIKLKLLGLRWDDHQMRRMWESDQRRVEALIAKRKLDAESETAS